MCIVVCLFWDSWNVYVVIYCLVIDFIIWGMYFGVVDYFFDGFEEFFFIDMIVYRVGREECLVIIWWEFGWIVVLFV